MVFECCEQRSWEWSGKLNPRWSICSSSSGLSLVALLTPTHLIVSSAGQSALMLRILEDAQLTKLRCEDCITTVRPEHSQYFLYDVAVVPISSKEN